jgi:glycine/D-amino acid oxidase-like deaminating enzyme
LRHYASFSNCPSLQRVDQRYDQENMDLKKYGVHVLVSQNNHGELIIGDSHEYSKTVEPFNTEHIHQLILNYLNTFANLGDLTIIERWQGVYPKLHEHLSVTLEPEPGVYIINGLGGAGMTLSFGLAEGFFSKL